MKYKRPVQRINRFVLKNLAILLGVSFTLGSAGAPLSELFYEEVNAATQFSDDANIRDYSREAVESLISAGRIKGYPEDNTFRPQGTITKLEFLSMCVNACDPSGEKVKTASDESKIKIPSDDMSYYDELVGRYNLNNIWGGNATELVTGASKLYVLGGLSSNDLTAPITRSEAASIMAKSLSKIKGETLPTNFSDYDMNKTIGDYSAVSSDSNAQSIKQLYLMGILEGDQNRVFNPSATLTREDSAVMIYKCLNVSKRDTSGVVESTEEIKSVSTTPDDWAANRGYSVGDVVTGADGKTYTLKEGMAGVIGEGQPLSLCEGKIGASNNKTVENYSGSDGTYAPLGDTYIVNPETGEGHWKFYEWDRIAEAYRPTDTGKDGEVRTFGLGGWCKYEWNSVANK